MPTLVSVRYSSFRQVMAREHTGMSIFNSIPGSTSLRTRPDLDLPYSDLEWTRASGSQRIYYGRRNIWITVYYTRKST